MTNQPTLVDTSGFIAALTDEPASASVWTLLESQTAVVSVITLAELRDVLQRVRGFDAESIEQRIDGVSGAGVQVQPLDAAVSRFAGQIRAEAYQRRTSEVSWADCILIATALHEGYRLATSDAVLASVARSRGVDVVPLPNSAGLLP